MTGTTGSSGDLGLRQRPAWEALERHAASVLPAAVDEQCVRLPFRDRRPELLVRQHASFDSAGIEKHREPRIVGVPKLLLNFYEFVFQRLAFFIEHANVLPSLAAARRNSRTRARRAGPASLTGWPWLLRAN